LHSLGQVFPAACPFLMPTLPVPQLLTATVLPGMEMVLALGVCIFLSRKSKRMNRFLCLAVCLFLCCCACNNNTTREHGASDSIPGGGYTTEPAGAYADTAPVTDNTTTNDGGRQAPDSGVDQRQQKQDLQGK